VPSQIQNPRATNLAVSGFGLVGRPSLLFDEIIVGVALLADFTDPFSSGAVERRIAGGAAFIGATAAETSSVQLFNPPGSNAIVVVRDVYITSGTASTAMRLRTQNTAAATLSTASGFRDTRIAGNPVAELRTDSTVGAPGVSPAWVIQSTDTGGQLFIPGVDIILAPGFGVVIDSGAANMSVTGGYLWEERTATPSGT